MCLRVIKPRIISCNKKDSFFDSIFSFFFDPFSYCWVSFLPFPDIFCFFLSFFHIPTFSRVSSSFFFFFLLLEPNSFRTCLLMVFFLCYWNGTWSIIILKIILLDILPPNVEGDPWSGIRRKIIKLKRGSNWIIFYEWEDREKWPFFISNIII